MSNDYGQVEIKAEVSTGVKCPRCWHYHNLRDTYDNLCDRCQKILVENFPDHPSVPHIKTAAKSERKKYCVRPDDQACPHLHCCRND